ncbi:CBS domain-containing protein [candidate division KSB3 bacterium]|uniref:CBS domain-containing protein n=1 Tax=candidate division KSB3 bacterium TaxID=2044937 RepID=A0A9D5Q626_9BACT|nr:CBS domain-containing protein [candidate division KSB3 bacterium]MBD3325260.1 CBS domain-containing protein [candidate division KSB3 bacterium]
MDVITTHLNADFDCLASMVAAKKLYPQAKIVFPGSQERNVRDFLNQVEFPFEFETTKTVDIHQITRLIIVDTKQADRIGELADILHKPYLKIHLYDHHPGDHPNFEAELEIIEDTGATTTIFVRLLRNQRLELTPMEATVLALGIYEDTGSLTFTSTRETDLMAVAYLLSKGADLGLVSEFINREMTPIQVRLLHDLMLSKREIVIEGTSIAIAKASSKRYIGDAAFIVHKWKEMENLEVVFALIRMGTKIHLVARSRGAAVNVGKIAAELGGGGHPYAASASIKQMTLIEAEEALIRELYKHIQEAHLAKRIMSSPVLSVNKHKTIRQTKNLLDGYTVNTLLVVEHGTPLGYITRQIVQRAIFHGLEQERVEEYMLTDLKTVTPETPFSEIELLMIQRPQKILPVVNPAGEAIGVITKNDILKVFQEYTLEQISYHRNITDQAHTRNVRRLMDERLPDYILTLLHNIGQLGDELEYSVYVVGGFVRDLILRAEENLDVDIVVEGDAIHFAKTFAERYQTRVRIHRKFCTAVVIFPDGFKIDVATARTEHYEYPAAMPIVKLGSIRLDLYRRDFTVNALAIKLNPKAFGKVFDYFGGQRDLKEKVIRVLHSLSFVEDPTRVFRAIRFEQRFHFRIGNFTFNLIRNVVKKGFIGKLSGRRVLNEFQIIFTEPNPIAILERMHELDVLKAVNPHLSSIEEMLRLFRSIRAVMAWYELLYREEPVEVWLLYFLGFIDKLTDPQLQEFCEYLKINQKTMQKIWIARDGYALIERPLHDRGDQVKHSDIYAVFAHLPTEAILFWMAKTKQECVKKAASTYFSKLRDVSPESSGKDLIALGLPPGPIFQTLLTTVRNARLNGEVSTKAQELELIQQTLAQLDLENTRNSH